MESKDIIAYLKNAKKKTPVCIYIKTKQPVDFPNTEIYGIQDKIIFGDWVDIHPVLEKNKEYIIQYHVESSCRYSACDLFNPLSCHVKNRTWCYYSRQGRYRRTCCRYDGSCH